MEYSTKIFFLVIFRLFVFSVELSCYCSLFHKIVKHKASSLHVVIKMRLSERSTERVREIVLWSWEGEPASGRKGWSFGEIKRQLSLLKKVSGKGCGSRWEMAGGGWRRTEEGWYG